MKYILNIVAFCTMMVALFATPVNALPTEPTDITPAQKRLECLYQGQLVRGLMSVMALAQNIAGEIPPMDYMMAYLYHFYDQNKPEEKLAAVSAAKALQWIYENKPSDDGKISEQAYYAECMGDKKIEAEPDYY